LVRILSKIPDFEIEDGENFSVIYAMGCFGGLDPSDGRMIFYVDRLKTKPVRGQPGQEELDKVVRERQVEIHMSPATWKSIAKWMTERIEKYEKQFGPIPDLTKGPTKKEGSQPHVI